MSFLHSKSILKLFAVVSEKKKATRIIMVNVIYSTSHPALVYDESGAWNRTKIIYLFRNGNWFLPLACMWVCEIDLCLR